MGSIRELDTSMKDVDECYEMLAACVVEAACDDYIQTFNAHKYDKSINKAKRQLEIVNDLLDDVLNDTDFDYKNLNYLKDFVVRDLFKKLRAKINKIVKSKNRADATNLLLRYKMICETDVSSREFKRDSRFGERRFIERFFRSPLYSLYSSDAVDPEIVIRSLRKRAIEKYGEDDDQC